MLSAFTKGLQQLDDRAVRRVLWLGIGAAILVLVALWAAVGYALTHFAWFETGWLNTVVDILGGVATLVLTWVLFPVVISTVISLWLEEVADAVEARHYPALPKARGQSLGQTTLIAVRFLAVAVGLNLLILPLIVLPPVFPFVFYSVNGYLLGREYFELVALRRVGFEEARALRKANQGRLFVAGVAVAFLLTVPLVNLLAPLVATAAMVHLFQTWRGGDGPHLRRAYRIGRTKGTVAMFKKDKDGEVSGGHPPAGEGHDDMSAPPLKPFSKKGSHVPSKPPGGASSFQADIPRRVASIPSVPRRIERGRVVDADSKRLFVGRDICLNGEITSCDKLVVEGRVEASLSNARVIEVTPTGTFRGSAHVEEADISGRYEGDLIATDKLIVRAGGQISGSIRYGKIVIESGGEISGDMQTLDHASLDRAVTSGGSSDSGGG